MNAVLQPLAAVRRAVAAALLAGSAAAAQDTAPIYQWSTLAGRASIGFDDGPGAAARFNRPTGLALDLAGNLYVADTQNHTIRRISPEGVVSTVAGSPGEPGSADGLAVAARFNFPEGVAVDAAWNVYVADTGNHTIRRITPAGWVTTPAGQAGEPGAIDGEAAAARFDSPRRIATDNVGNVYVLNHGIRRISGGTVQTILAAETPTLTSPGYTGPVRVLDAALAVDAGRRIFFEAEVRLAQYRIPINAVLKMESGGALSVVSALPQLPWAQNAGLLALDAGGDLWGTETAWKIHGARELVVRFDAGGSATTIGVIRDAAGAEEHAVRGLVVSPGGELIYSRDDNVIVRMAADGTQVVLAGTPQGVLRDISSLAIDATGTVWAAATEVGFSDHLYLAENEIATAPVLLRAPPNGAVTAPIRRGFVFSRPVTYLAATVDPLDNVYFAGVQVPDQALLDRIRPDGLVTSTALSLPRNEAQYYGLGAFVTNPAGNLILPDRFNHVVWQRTPDDQWSVLAGQMGMAGADDGVGDRARFGELGAITMARDGNCYVLDRRYAAGTLAACVIRRITSDGTVSTVTDDLLQKPGLAGMVSGYQTGIAIDSHGAFYLPNLVDRTVRRLSAQGEVTLVGGASQEPGSADGLAGNARFVAPLAVAVDANDNLYVSDGGYRSPTIRKAQLAGPPAITVQPQSQTVAAGGSAQFTVTASGVPTPTYQWRFNGAPIAGATDTTFGIFFAQSANAGQYSVVVTNALGSVTSDLATLAVTSTSSPPPSAASGGSGGGGVGAGFVTLLAISAAVRRLTAGRRA